MPKCDYCNEKHPFAELTLSLVKTWTLFAALAWLPGGLVFGQAASLPTPATGATVDESRVEITLYVDPANAEAADDDKHGAADSPFATLGYGCLAAAKAKDENKGVKLILANGTYRETAVIPAPKDGKDTEAPLVIEAAERDQAIIDGADTEGWTPSTWKTENGRWTHAWPGTRMPGRDTDKDFVMSPTHRRGGLLFVNDLPLRQVNTEAELAPGTFWLNFPTIATAGRKGVETGASVVVQPPEEAELAGAVIQVGGRVYSIDIRGRRNVVLRGLLCQHAANPKEPGGGSLDMAGLLLARSSNVLVEDVLAQWNDGAGIDLLGDTDVTLRRVRSLHNGSSALSARQTNQLLAEDCEASFNGFRAEWSKVPSNFISGAAVSVSGEGMTWRRLHAVGNGGPGVSLAGTNATLEDSVITDNVLTGLWITGAGPSSVRRCTISGTKLSGDGKIIGLNGGVMLTSATDVTLQSNAVAGNAGAQVIVNASPLPPKNKTARHTFRHNVFVGTDTNQLLCLWQEPDALQAGGIGLDYHTLSMDENCFWNPARETGFATYKNPFFFSSSGVPSSRLPSLVQPDLTFEKWREWLAARGSEAAQAHSIWQDPGFIAVAEGDFRLKEGSPVAGWELPSEDASSSP